jgi:hypothetical protein
MVIKLKEGCLVELRDIKMAQAVESYSQNMIEISYFDNKKNPDARINCDSEEEANSLVDKLLEEINSSHKVRV